MGSRNMCFNMPSQGLVAQVCGPRCRNSRDKFVDKMQPTVLAENFCEFRSPDLHSWLPSVVPA